MASETLTLEVDWGNDGTFDHASADISADMLEVPNFAMGRDGLSQLNGRSSAGSMAVILRNDDNKYSRNVSGSPVFGLIKPNRRVRLKSVNSERHPSADFVSANSESLSIADNAALSAGNVVLVLSVAVNLDTIGADRDIVTKWLESGNHRDYRVFYDHSSLRFRFEVSSDGTLGNVTSVDADELGPVSAGVDYYLVVKHDPVADTITIKVDDGSVDSEAHAGGVNDGNGDFVIGSRDGGSNHMDGHIAVVGFWKGGTILTSSQDSELYNGGNLLLHKQLDGDIRDDLVAYYNLDEASGTRVDSEGSNDLTDNNTVLAADGPWGAVPSVQWHGYLDDIVANARRGGAHTARLEAFGPLAKTAARNAYVSPSASVLTGAAFTNVLDAVGFPAADRAIDVGLTTMTRHFVPGLLGSFALHQIEETEAGFLRENRDAGIAFEDRHHRLKGAHDTVQATFNAAAGSDIYYQRLEPTSPMKDIANIVRAKVNIQTVGGSTDLWAHPETGADSPELAPGEVRTFIAEYPTPDAANQNIGVGTWTTPVATTDINAQTQAIGGSDLDGDITVDNVQKGVQTMEFDITNGAAVPMFLQEIKARGTPLTKTDAAWVQVKNAGSIAIYDEREYTIPAEFLPDTAQALDYARYIAAIYGQELPGFPISFKANQSKEAMDAALTLNVSDRVHLINTDEGLARDMFIERKTDRIEPGNVHVVDLELSDVEEGFGRVIVLDVGPGLDTGILGY